jgi:hypothetical protein
VSQTAYVMSCEILCGEGSDGALEGIERAYLLVGVHAANEDEAMAKFEDSFEEEGYGLVEADWIARADEVEWTDPEGEAEGKDLIARMAMVPDDVVYGPLYDADDAEEIDEAA